MSEPGKVWITWERQRRSIELAGILGCDLYVFDFEGRSRYPKCIYNTLKVFLFSRYKIVFVQNPSMLLAALACLFKWVTRRRIIVDRHTNFRINKQRIVSSDWMVFDLLNNFTIKNADLTIVTNEYLAGIVRDMGGRAYVLPDKLPDLKKSRDIQLEGFSIFMISSFGGDEPVAEAIVAAGKLEEEGVKLYISGNSKKLDPAIRKKSQGNVTFTDFLSEQDFTDHVYAADAIMALTTADYCMLCGCYEAVAAGRPLITSDKQVLRQYFTGSVFVENSADGICNGIIELMEDYEICLNNVAILKEKINSEWEQKFSGFKEKIGNIDSNSDT
ncbi:MAG: glycosyltransferase [Desulfobacterales bacterium]|nr:glycosyltransferase [Desulfobacterales bacterium]